MGLSAEGIEMKNGGNHSLTGDTLCFKLTRITIWVR